MNILVTNDDGISSPGIWQLASSMSRIGSALIVAPDKEQSATGTSVTLRSTTAVKEVPSSLDGVKAYSVEGTPNDCVLVGLRLMRESRIDLIVSGINYGPNCGRDIPHSGTVMATLPGYFRKIPSIAVSLAVKSYAEELRYDVAAGIVESVAAGIIDGGLPRDCILNINVPNIPLAEVKGILVTKTAPTSYIRLMEKKADARYSVGIGKSVTRDMMEGTDIEALESGYISITPLCIEVTHHDLIPQMREGIEKIEAILPGKTPSFKSARNR